MTQLEKAARMALEALDSLLDVAMVPMTCEGLCSAESVDKWHDFSFRRDALRSALTQALATTEPVKPLFVAKVAAQKWAELQEQGHRMQTIWFDGGPGGSGTIDPWGKVTWSKTEPATTERKGEPSRGMIGMGAQALASELVAAVAQDNDDPDGQDMSAGMFGPAVSTWLRKVAAEYLSKEQPKPNQCRGITDPGCKYLAACGAVCNKCGKQHSGSQPAITSPQVPEDVIRDAERYRKIRQGSAWPCAFASHDAPEPLTGDDLDAAADAARKGE